MRSSFFKFFTFFCYALFLSSCDQKKDAICIYQFQEIPALSQTKKGIKDTIQKYNSNIRIQTGGALGNAGIQTQIITSLLNTNPKVMVTLGTLPSQITKKLMQRKQNITPLVFSSVTDPVLASVVTSIQKRDENITGVSNFIDLDEQIALFKQIQPNLKVIGMVYSLAEENSKKIISELDNVCKKNNIKLLAKGITKTSEISQAVLEISSKVDAVFISNDTTILSSLPAVIKQASKNKIPVYASDTDNIDQGVLCAFGPNQYEIGVQTGKMIIEILEGKSAKDIHIEYPKEKALWINLKKAKEIGVNIPQAIIKKAKIVK